MKGKGKEEERSEVEKKEMTYRRTKWHQRFIHYISK